MSVTVPVAAGAFDAGADSEGVGLPTGDGVVGTVVADAQAHKVSAAVPRITAQRLLRTEITG